MKRYWFEVPEGNEAIVQSMMKEMGIEVKEMTARRSSRFGKECGSGFGDHVWRVNCDRNRVEASFAKPCSDSKKLKSLGFKWLHEDGIWYAPNEQLYANICTSIGLEQTDCVVSKQ